MALPIGRLKEPDGCLMVEIQLESTQKEELRNERIPKFGCAEAGSRSIDHCSTDAKKRFESNVCFAGCAAFPVPIPRGKPSRFFPSKFNPK